MKSGSFYKVWNTTLHHTWISGMLCGTNQGEAGGLSMQTVPNISRNSRWGNGWINNRKILFQNVYSLQDLQRKKSDKRSNIGFFYEVCGESGTLASKSDIINCKTNVFVRFSWCLFKNVLQLNKLTKYKPRKAPLTTIFTGCNRSGWFSFKS